MSTTHLFNYKYNNVKADNYGRYYWGVTLSDGRDIYVHADRAIITDTGDLMFISDADSVKSRKETVANLVLAQNQWAAYFGANVITGEPVSLDNSFPVDAEERKVKRTANEDLDSEEKIEVIRTMLNQLASETDKEDVVIAKMVLTSIIDQSFRQVK